MNDIQKQIETLGDISADTIEQLKAALEIVIEIEKYKLMPLTFKFSMPNYDKLVAEVFCTKAQTWEDHVGRFQLSEFPSSTKALVCHEARIADAHRNKGYGKELHKLRIRAANLAGYKKLLATVLETNEIEKKILVDNGWKKLTGWDSWNGTVELWERTL